MTPAFKNGDYDKGVEEGVAAIVARLEGKGDLPPDAAPSSSGGDAVRSGSTRRTCRGLSEF